MDLPFNRIIIDSRHAASGNSTSFEVSLPESISLPPHAVCFVTDLQVTHTFSSMSNRNEFYFIERDANGVTLVNRAILDTSKTHTADSLASELQTQMNAVSTLSDPGGYTVTFSEDTGLMTFTRAAPGSFMPANDDLLQTPAFQQQAVCQTRGSSGLEAYTPYYNSSMAQLLGLGPRGSMNTSWEQLQLLANLGTTHFSGAVDTRRHHCIYLHSPTLTNFRVLGPSGSRSCIARVPVTSGYGSILTKEHSGHVLDHVPCGGACLRTLLFDLRDANNEPVDLRGGHVSFSLMFATTII